MQSVNRTFTLPDFLNTAKLPGLDGLRGVSIIMVIFHHVIYQNNGFLNELNFGDLGVQIFFVISGFLITTLLKKEKITKGSIDLKGFYIRRVFRIMPLVFLYLTVLIILNFFYRLEIPWLNFLTSFFFLGNIPFEGINVWYTRHFWSLAVEEQFYMVAPFLIRLLPKRNYFILLLICFLTVPLANHFYWQHQNDEHFSSYFLTLARTTSLLMGHGTLGIMIGSAASILCFRYHRIMTPWIGKKWMGLFLFVAAISLRVVFKHAYIVVLLFNIIIALMVIANLNAEGYLTRILENRWLSFVGVLSYSLYVWQQLFTNIHPWSGSFPLADNLLFNLALLFVVAYLSHVYFEKSFISLRKRIFKY